MNTSLGTHRRGKFRCWAEIDFGSLAKNVRAVRKRIGRSRGIIAVVKANGYGHGLGPMAGGLFQLGVRHLGVATPEEALEARQAAPRASIILLSGSVHDEIADIVRLGFLPTISSWYEAEAFSKAAQKMKKTVRVHVKIDTGMGRLGIWHEAARVLLRRIASTPGLRIEGLYTHLATADSHRGFAITQRNRLCRVIAEAARNGIRPPLLHFANSAATLGMSQDGFTHVRPGLCLYGLSPIPGRFGLEPILSLRSRVTLIKDIGPGRRLSYDSLYVAKRRMRVATLAVGYADGFNRHLTNASDVLIHGRRCRQLGRVTMDEIIVDVSKVRDVRWGDTATLIGRDGSEEISAHDLARQSGTIPWEIFTSLSQRVKRIYRG